MALYSNLKLNMYVVAACLNTNSEGARKLLEQCNPKHFLLTELDIRKSASILHIEKTILNLLASDSNLGNHINNINLYSKAFHMHIIIETYLFHFILGFYRAQLFSEQCRCYVFW